MYAQLTLENFLGKKLPFSKTFNGKEGDDFSAHTEATAYLREKGFDVGSMQRGAPIGIARNADISKWRNLGDDVKNLDGVMVSDSFRDSPVTVYLTEEPV